MDSNMLHLVLLDEIGSSRFTSVKMGEFLYELKQNDNWRTAIGDGLESWQSYLAQPEIGLTVGEANKLISIYEVYVLKHGYSLEAVYQVSLKNLQALLPTAKNEDSIEELFLAAQHLSYRDLKERIQDIKSNDDGVRTYEYIIMQKCKETGSMRKVHEFSNTDIDTMIQRYQDERQSN